MTIVIDISLLAAGILLGIFTVHGWRRMKRMQAKKTAKAAETVPTLSSLFKIVPPRETESVGIPEVDELLGGGWDHGQTIVITGPMGIGKTTLALQIAAHIAKDKAGFNVMYASGDQQEEDVVSMCKRLGVAGAEADNLHVSTLLHDIDLICDEAEARHADVLVIDPVDAMILPNVDAVAGSVEQIDAIGLYLTGFAKKDGVCVIVITHDHDDDRYKTLYNFADAVLCLGEYDTEDLTDGDVIKALKHVCYLSPMKSRYAALTYVDLELTSEGFKSVGEAKVKMLKRVGLFGEDEDDELVVK